MFSLGILSWVQMWYRFCQAKVSFQIESTWFYFNEKKNAKNKNSIEVTCAWSGFRHVAKMCFVGLLNSSSCLTKPKPSPRLQPVIRIEFILFVICTEILRNFSIPDIFYSTNRNGSGQTTWVSIYRDVKDCLSKEIQYTRARFFSLWQSVYAARYLFLHSQWKKRKRIESNCTCERPSSLTFLALLVFYLCATYFPTCKCIAVWCDTLILSR